MTTFRSVVPFLLEDFGWQVTFRGMVGDHPGDGGWPSMLIHTVLILWNRYSCQISSLCSTLLVDFGKSYLLLLVTCCDGGKTKSTPSPTDLDCTVRLDFSLTISSVAAKWQCSIILEGKTILQAKLLSWSSLVPPFYTVLPSHTTDTYNWPPTIHLPLYHAHDKHLMKHCYTPNPSDNLP